MKMSPWRPGSVGPAAAAAVLAALALSNAVLANPLWSPQHLAGGTGRNIRHLPCISRRTGEAGTCMFAIDCAKLNGTHLGTCIDRFFFGSCCRMPAGAAAAQLGAVDTNQIDQEATPPGGLPELVTWTTVHHGKPPSLPQVSTSSRPSYRPTLPPERNYSVTVTVSHASPPSRLSTEAGGGHGAPPTPKPTPPLATQVPLTTVSAQRPSTSPSTQRPLTSLSTHWPLSSISTHWPLSSVSTQSPLTSVSMHRPLTSVSTQKPLSSISTQRPPTSTSTQRPQSSSSSQRPQPSASTQRPTTTVTVQKPSSTFSSYKPLSSVLSTLRPPVTTATPPPQFSSQRPRPPVTTQRPRPPATTQRPRPPATTQRPHTTVMVQTPLSTVTVLRPQTHGSTQRPIVTKKPLPTIIVLSTTRTPINASTVLVQIASSERPPTTASLVTTKRPLVTSKRPPVTGSSAITSRRPPVTFPRPTGGPQASSTTRRATPTTKKPQEATTSTTELQTPSSFPPTIDGPLVTFTQSQRPQQPVRTTSKPPSTWVQLDVTTHEPVTTEKATPKPGMPTSSVSSGTSVTALPVTLVTTRRPPTVAGTAPGRPSSPPPAPPVATGSSPASPSPSSSPPLPPSSSPSPSPPPEVAATSTPGDPATTAPTAPPVLPVETNEVVDHVNMSNYKDVCGRRLYPESRVVGGQKATFGKWPWQISLRQWRTSTYLHKCGAALLNENWAITAAHCVENVPPSDLLLRLGEHDLSVEEEPYKFEERRVQIVASHPQFDPRTFEYDLALLRFYEPVSFRPNIIPICVPEDDTNFVGSTAYVTGWGRLYEDGPLPSVLQEVSVPVINNSVCETMYRAAGYIEHIPNIFICAGWRKGGFDSCEGDSGGPMVIQREDKRWLLAGVISWGIGCAEPNQPGVYTRISQFRHWINQILQF